MKCFTDKALRALKPAARRYEVIEPGRTGLRVRVSPTGRRSFYYVYRHDGRLRYLKLGDYPETSLAEARERLAEEKKLRRRGTDPAVMRKVQRLESKKALTVRDLCALYLEKYARPKKRSWEEDERILEKDVIPRWGDVPAVEIERRDVVALLDSIVDRGAPIAANRTLAIVRRMFNYALERDLLKYSPCAGVRAPGKERRRDRVLTAEEIAAFWHGIEEVPCSVFIKRALKLQLVTAQRKGELVGAAWSEFADGWWTIPASRAKNGLAHRVPLSSLALEILEDTPRTSSPWVFPGKNWERHLLPTSIDHAVRRIEGMPKFTPHDLRRTAASHMASLGVPRVVIGKILNHAEPGVTAVYDRHSYDVEKREALEMWSGALRAILASAGR